MQGLKSERIIAFAIYRRWNIKQLMIGNYLNVIDLLIPVVR
ncbi:hypothetical protein GLUCOINTEAF2_0201930 [Komagataeibacter intermedius AF2]|uniref:Uncharacterized protein n=1 Tax=Komagataeibacter intermedius AF2 TaxID=1458464 RepID=A0A0N1FAE6_9PROT|nr:hypothetical protein GLUCOINTEAF2_0201930 [Komagataeibacter intermedius AF2]